MFLHEHPSFKELVEAVAFERETRPAIIEKDYWVMHALWGLGESGFTYYFKGGTSLSKGFGIIKRFSEDLDLQIDPPEGMRVYIGKNHQKPKHRESRSEFFNWIITNIKVEGLSVGLHQSRDSKNRNYEVELSYDSLFPRDAVIKRNVLLEIGFARVTPNEKKDISSWAFDRALAADLSITENRAKAVSIYKPEYTFIEKLDAIQQKYRKEKPPREWVRHYYDVYMLLQQPSVRSFVGTEPYNEHMTERFKDEAHKLSESPAFKFDDPARLQALRAAHDAENGLYFETQPSFEEIVNLFREWSPRL